ncbi:protein of unknown function [Cognatiyoonia koreensis]|uniref:DUF3291 domain-containing protein n=1 Tax=Cognatiyoonia koreensis TaxID=364200 RepID=A0A1I0NKW4_9RHOB|nr:DUF3291 domain-containing protein [Cognatiyoonia koreensis]SEW02033.1 protein of unknown function [Cognatiyoonia koreensis]
MHLAELNIGRLVADTDDPRVAEFMNNLDRINGLGKRMPGFVWMMEGTGGQGNTDAKLDDSGRLVPNLTVWETAESLEIFVFKTLHKAFMARRAEWFEVLGDMHFVMWWVPEGHHPSLDEAMGKLQHLRDHGETPDAFGWTYLRAHPHAPEQVSADGSENT